MGSAVAGGVGGSSITGVDAGVAGGSLVTAGAGVVVGDGVRRAGVVVGVGWPGCSDMEGDAPGSGAGVCPSRASVSSCAV